MAFSDWSTTASANTTVGGIDIGEGCPPSNLNNAIREVMAEVRVAFNPALDPFFSSATKGDARLAIDAYGRFGGTISGNIIRESAGTHLYHVNSAMLSGRIFLTAAGASDPTSLAGDIWLTY